MGDRDSQFPERENRIPDRGGQIRSNSPSRTVGRPLRPHRIFGPLLVLGVAAALYYFDRPDTPVSPHRAQSPALSPELKPAESPALSLSPMPEPAASADSGAATSMPPPVAPMVDPSGESETKVEDALVPIGLGFRPVGFRIVARSSRLALTDRVPSEVRGLPRFQGADQRYGLLELGGGRRYRFVLDGAPDGYLLYLDRNRNGDLRDDGPPVKNRGPYRFSGKIVLPLQQLSLVPQLQGDYTLWLFSSPRGWQEGWLSYYCMTQLSGELLLGGRRYTAYLADNLAIDGDYRNDGIYIDLDGNGRIDVATEFFPPGVVVEVNGGHYRFQVVY